MKKLTILILMAGMVLPLFAERLNLGDPGLVERFGKHIVKDKIDLYDPDTLGLWVLQHDYRQKYNRVHNDEFELDDAKKWALEKFKLKLSKLKPIDPNAEYDLYLGGVSFGKYDFKEERFPLKGAIEEGTYMQYPGKDYIVKSWHDSILKFENATSKDNFIPMEKAEAKKFLRSRKDKYGNIDRRLVAHYVYTLVGYEEDEEFIPNSKKMTIKFKGKLKFVEFMDEKKKRVLRRIDFLSNTVSDMNNTNKGGE